MMPALELLDVAVPFGGQPGLAAVSLTVAAGERVAVVGPSGAGKTSLLRAAAGLAPLGGGRVYVGGLEATTLPPERRNAVYLHQAPLLFPHLTVSANVEFPLLVRGVRAAERAARARELLAAVRLAELGERMPATLSGGQRHRVALARAAASGPAAMLLDEPLAGLDPVLRTEVGRALRTLQAQSGAGVLLVTHDFDDAALLADRIGVLIDGALTPPLAPATLLTHPPALRVARFLGGFVELPGVLRHGTFESVLGAVRPARVHAGDGPAVAVVRSDGLVVETGSTTASVEEVRVLPGRVEARVRVGSAELVLTVPAATAPRPGETLRLGLVPELVSVFSDPAPGTPPARPI